MGLEKELEELKKSLRQADCVQTELDRRVYYLRTLYDVSKDIFGTVEYESILNNFLMMTMGNFGVAEGFILTLDVMKKDIDGFISVGFQGKDISILKTGGSEILLSDDLVSSLNIGADSKNRGLLPQSMICTFPFNIDKDSRGIMGLGAKLIEEPYTPEDQELLATLVNNLVVALKNAKSFNEIINLNKELHEKNTQLETTLSELRASMKKVKLLESIKDNLSKFVPATVTRMIEKSPSNSIPESKEQDLTVLFIDIEGYTKLCEELSILETNEVIEKHFSAFMEAIYSNNGDVLETAGDGLMILFLNENEKGNAMEAVQTALAIKDKSSLIFKECTGLYRPLNINMGINSGKALVGAAKFETYSGSHWTYTTIGNTINVAARIGAQASGGSIYLTKSTANRIKGHFSTISVGSFKLKNVSEKTEIFRI